MSYATYDEERAFTHAKIHIHIHIYTHSHTCEHVQGQTKTDALTLSTTTLVLPFVKRAHLENIYSKRLV